MNKKENTKLEKIDNQVENDAEQNNNQASQASTNENNDCIEKRHEELRADYQEIKDSLQRVYAEFQNYRKRNEEERQKFVILSNEQLIKKILPIIDNFEMALVHRTKEEENSEFSKGIELIYTQLIQLLEDEGVVKISSIGKFDPKVHEVILTEESDKENETILQEFQKGYMLSDRVLRPSKVKIVKNNK